MPSSALTLGGLLGWVFFGIFDDMNKRLANSLLTVFLQSSDRAE